MNQQNKKPLAGGTSGSKKLINKKVYSTNLACQRQRLLNYLNEKFSITVNEARVELSILHCPARVLELRKIGYDIRTIWVDEYDQNGIFHRVGRYYFFGNRVTKISSNVKGAANG